MRTTAITSTLLCVLLASTAEGQRRAQGDTQVPGGTVAATPQQQVVSDCPLPDGFFADAHQCDKYYQCVDNVITEKLCPDGLAFVDHNPRAEKCDYITAVDCSTRPQLQPPQPLGACLRQNGYYYHPDPTVCNQFFFCSEGTGNLVTCPEGLVFNNRTNNCVWADEAGRTGCATTTGGQIFDCPKVTHDVAVAHPRYADPDDCQFFYVCIDGVNPRRNGCTFGQVFNEEVGACTPPAEVPECADYYTQYFDEYFRTLDTGGRPRGDIIAAAFDAGYDIPITALGKVDRTQSQRPQQVQGSVGAAGAPARQATTPRRRRPSAQAAPAIPTSVPAPVEVPVEDFSLSTGFDAAVDPVPVAAPVPQTVPKRRSFVRRTQRPVQ